MNSDISGKIAMSKEIEEIYERAKYFTRKLYLLIKI